MLLSENETRQSNKSDECKSERVSMCVGCCSVHDYNSGVMLMTITKVDSGILEAKIKFDF